MVDHRCLFAGIQVVTAKGAEGKPEVFKEDIVNGVVDVEFVVFDAVQISPVHVELAEIFLKNLL